MGASGPSIVLTTCSLQMDLVLGGVPVIVVLLLVAFGIIYYWVPNAEHPQWHWITPGAIVALALWFIASFRLRYYLEFFNTYSRTYGALTAVIVILLWFYVTGAAIFIVGENSELEQANRGGAVCAWCGNKMAVSPEQDGG